MSYATQRTLILDCIKGYKLELEILDALGDVEGMGQIYISRWRTAIDIEPEGKSAREVAINILSALKAKGRPPATAQKTFDKDNGKVTFKIPGPIVGWTINVSGGEPRCKIKKVVEQKEVPVYEQVQTGTAIKEVVTFEIENPEECGAEVKE